MTADSSWSDKMDALLDKLCTDALTDGERRELNELLRGGPEQRLHYRRYMHLHAAMKWNASAWHDGAALRQVLADGGGRPTEIGSSRLSTAPLSAVSLVRAADVSGVPTASSSGFSVLSAPLQGAVGYFSSGWPAAYLIATVIFAVGLWIGSLVHVSDPVQIARQSVLPSTSGRGAGGEDSDNVAHWRPAVGRITGMVDCRWQGSGFRVQGSGPENQKSEIRNQKSLVFLGDKFSLASGLMEISYDSGAKVILQGPVTYEAESKDGGYLSVGKLTARVQSAAPQVPSPKPQDPGPKSDAGIHPSSFILHPSSLASNPSSLIPHPLFSIRTPTATVTDLGTEFGVEVDHQGDTTSRVFRGLVRVQMLDAGGKPEGDAQLLRENESAHIESHAGRQGSSRVIMVASSTRCRDFIRESPQRTLKVLDLVDVVAGGDGFSGRRGRGIDPTTGRISDIQSDSKLFEIQGDYKYHRVEGIPFVDGVFIPDGSRGPVQIDSAGHVFPDCPRTDNRSWVNVWAGGRVPQNLAVRMSADLGGIDYFSPKHPALLMHANKGLTFDLDAIRRDNPNDKVLRFRAVTGNMEPESEKGDNVSADIWVMVDAQVRFKRRDINHFIGAMPINITITDNDHFLTLAATDGGNTLRCDQIIFGDPRLELVPAKLPVNDTK